MASKGKTLYVGFTNVLKQRVWQHKTNLNPDSFASKYNCKKLVYFEEFKYVLDAIGREKEVKNGAERRRLI